MFTEDVEGTFFSKGNTVIMRIGRPRDKDVLNDKSHDLNYTPRHC